MERQKGGYCKASAKVVRQKDVNTSRLPLLKLAPAKPFPEEDQIGHVWNLSSASSKLSLRRILPPHYPAQEGRPSGRLPQRPTHVGLFLLKCPWYIPKNSVPNRRRWAAEPFHQTLFRGNTQSSFRGFLPTRGSSPANCSQNLHPLRCWMWRAKIVWLSCGMLMFFAEGKWNWTISQWAGRWCMPPKEGALWFGLGIKFREIYLPTSGFPDFGRTTNDLCPQGQRSLCSASLGSAEPEGYCRTASVGDRIGEDPVSLLFAHTTLDWFGPERRITRLNGWSSQRETQGPVF